MLASCCNCLPVRSSLRMIAAARAPCHPRNTVPSRLALDPQYDLVVMATYPELASMLETQHSLLLQRRPGQRILLTVHNPRYLLESAGGLAPLLLLAQHAAGGEGDSKQQAVQPVQMLALAPCSASYTSTLFGAWAADVARWMPGWDAPTGKAAKPEVPWIVPLVPWAPANETKGGKGLASKGEGEYRGPLAHFCIQVGRAGGG